MIATVLLRALLAARACVRTEPEMKARSIMQGTRFGTKGVGMARFGRVPLSIFVSCLCVLLLAGGCSKSEKSDGTLNTSQLPRVAGAKEVFASPASTIFTTTSPVAAGGRCRRQGARHRGLAEIRRAAHFAARERQPAQPVAEERAMGARRVHHGCAGARQCHQRAIQRGAAQKRCAVSERRQQHRVRSEQAAADAAVRRADRQDVWTSIARNWRRWAGRCGRKSSTAFSRRAVQRAN